ncbi:MAG: indolepyruvate ferredoxin oxidoreductase subunit alpha [Dethiobacteria bacterium]|jgi:ferredoxin
MAFRILADECTACGTCIDACPSDAIKEEGDVCVIDLELCSECGTCVDECPMEAIIEE